MCLCICMQNYYENAFYVTKAFNETLDSEYSRSQFTFGLPIYDEKKKRRYTNSYRE